MDIAILLFYAAAFFIGAGIYGVLSEMVYRIIVRGKGKKEIY